MVDHRQDCPKSSRLIADLNEQKHVRLHILYLKSLIEVGMKVSCVHRCVEFQQTSWMRQFVLDNTKKRDEAQNLFERNFFKLKINSQVR